MADSLTAKYELSGSASLVKDLDNRTAFGGVQFGQDDFPELVTEYAFGSLPEQINKQWVGKYTILTTANQDIDLAGSLVDDFGATITFTAIKEIVIAIESPDGTKSVRVGPQNVSNAWQGFWGGTGATVYETVKTHRRWSSPYAGEAVTAGTGDILRLNNPGAGTIIVHVLIQGVG